jgi:hypothetical protein
MDAVWSLDQITRLGIPFQAEIDVEHRPHLHLLPPFIPNVDHTAIHTDAFAPFVVTPRRREHHPFDTYTLVLTLYMGFEPCTVVLGLLPDTPRRNLPMSYALKHLLRLRVGQQTADPYHQARQFWTV